MPDSCRGTTPKIPDVLILGGGFAGLVAARALAARDAAENVMLPCLTAYSAALCGLVSTVRSG